jgi:hypothetical protein
MASLLNFTKLLKNTYALKQFNKIETEGILPKSFYEASITSLSKPYRHNKKRKLDANIPDKQRCKNPQFNSTLKRSYTIIQVGFIPGMQGWFNIHKSINIILHVNRTKDKNYIIISIDAIKALGKM